MIDYIYNDADDRPLFEVEEDEEFIQIFVDTSILIPVCVINGVPYYES